MLPTKFQFIWLRIFRGEDLNVKSKWMTDDRHQVMAKVHIALPQAILVFDWPIFENLLL
jgi:hypothetical protein